VSARELMEGTPYASYLYSYPHKTAYRPLDPPVSLRDAWAGERRDALFLYLHIPFCEMRCGFCNLFTAARPKEDFVAAYMAALGRQVRATRQALGPTSFARLAIGGGTPTLLDVKGLSALFELADSLGARAAELPCSVETSPETLDRDKVRLLAERGVDRVSIGVQSFFEDEVASVNRPQSTRDVEVALDLLRSAHFPTLNIDLMYGLGGQTRERWLASLTRALTWKAEEIYLYPLYVRPLTGLGRSSKRWDDDRLDLYRAGRDFLLERGYQQVSMRMFRRADAPRTEGPVYCCQQDGMLGLGCGARSYTDGLHYSSAYAVRARGVKEILAAWVERDEAAFSQIDYGIRLDEGERRRRHAILSVLSDEGLSFDGYRARFGADALDDLPQLGELEAAGAARRDGDLLRLTAAGFERSDAIGPWLVSPHVRGLMEDFELR
jgi:oxygen-independent coproporphyrinogen III oxidase